MKRNLLLILAIFCFQLGFSQIAWEEDTYNYAIASPSAGDHNIETHLLNNGASTINVGWTRTIEEMPSAWSNYICDPNLCYGPATSECPVANPVILAGGATGAFSIHVLTDANCGFANIKLDVHDFNGTELASANFIYEVCASSIDDPSFDDIEMYPNPTKAIFMLTANQLVDRIEVFNIVGSKIKAFATSPDNSYDISDLTQGFYFVSLMNDEGKVMRTMRLSKK